MDDEPVHTGVWEYQLKAQQEQYRRIFGPQWQQQLRGMNLELAIAQQMINEKLIVLDAKRLGITVSKEELGQAIQADSFFQRDGQFIGKEQYERAVMSHPFRFQNFLEYEDWLSEQLLRSKWISLVQSTVVIPDEEVETEFRRRTERVSAEYVFAAYSAYQEELEPSDAELRSWYDARSDEYSEGEARRAIYVLFDEASVGEIEITEEEIAASYEATKEQLFNRGHERRASHILIGIGSEDDAAAIEAARAKAAGLKAEIEGGADFAALAAEHSTDTSSKAGGGDLGWFGTGRMVGEFEEAVFGAAEGDLVGPVQTNYGFHVIKVTGIRENAYSPLDEVREQVRASLRFERQREKQQELARAFRTGLESADALRAKASEEGLELRDSGMVPRTGEVPDLGPSFEFVTRLFELEEGAVSDAFTVATGEAVIAFTDKVDDFVPPLDEKRRPRVLANYRQDKAREAAKAALENALARGGDNLERIAKRAKLEVNKTGSPVNRGSSFPGIGLDRAIEKAAFAAIPDTLVGPIEGERGVAILRVTAREEADMTELAKMSEQIKDQLAEPRLQEVLQKRIEALHESATIILHPALTQVPDQQS